MTTVTPTLEFYNGTAWVDITADEIAGTLSWYGGIRGAGPTERVAVPGQLQVEMDNSAGNSGAKLGYYSPDHANVQTGWRIGAKIRVKLVSGGNTRYWLYRITDVKPVMGQYGPRRVEVTASDYMDEFSKRKVSGLDIALDKSGEQLLALLVASLPFPPTATSYATGAFAMPYAFANERDEDTYCLTVLQKISQSDLSYIYVDGDATDGETLHFENHSSRLATHASAATLTNTMSDMDVEHKTGNIYNKIRCTVYPVDRDVVVSVLGSISEEFSMEPGEVKTLYIPYRDEGSERRISGILSLDPTYGYAPITANTDYRMSSKPNDGGNDLNANLSIVAVAGANNLMATVTNSAAVKGYVNLLQIRGFAVRMFDNIDSISSDTTSITAYGERTISYSMPYQNQTAVGQAFADELLRRHKDAKTHIQSVSFYANRNSTLMGYALTLGIGARVTITETATGVDTQFFVNGYNYELQAGNVLNVTWNLERNYSSGVAYWILGDTTYGILGSTTVLAIL
jgi:hypothetical protein